MIVLCFLKTHFFQASNPKKKHFLNIRPFHSFLFFLFLLFIQWFSTVSRLSGVLCVSPPPPLNLLSSCPRGIYSRLQPFNRTGSRLVGVQWKLSHAGYTLPWQQSRPRSLLLFSPLGKNKKTKNLTVNLFSFVFTSQFEHWFSSTLNYH